MVAVPSIGRAAQPNPQKATREADATRELYERYARQIYAYCFHQLRNKEEAEDATQSTFLNAFRGLQRGIDPEFEAAWLYKIAQNVCLTRQRSTTRRRRVELPGDLDAMQDVLPAREVDSHELIGLPEALNLMPEQQRRALLLREWQGLSYGEIADELGLSQAAVEALLFRARRSLASGLSEEQKRGLAKRIQSGGDAGSMVALLKSLLVTGGAKVAATVATVAATSAVVASPAARHAVVHAVSFQAPSATAAVHRPVVVAPSREVAAASSARLASSVARPAFVAPERPPHHRAAARPGAVHSHLRAPAVFVASVPDAPPAPAPVFPPPAAPAEPAPAVVSASPAPAPAPAPTPAAPAPAPAAASAPKRSSSGDRGNGKDRGKGNAPSPAVTSEIAAPIETVPDTPPATTPAPPTVVPVAGPGNGEDHRNGKANGNTNGNHGNAKGHATNDVAPPVPGSAPPAVAPASADAAPPAAATPPAVTIGAPAPAGPTAVQSADGSPGNGTNNGDRGNGHGKKP